MQTIGESPVVQRKSVENRKAFKAVENMIDKFHAEIKDLCKQLACSKAAESKALNKAAELQVALKAAESNEVFYKNTSEIDRIALAQMRSQLEISQAFAKKTQAATALLLELSSTKNNLNAVKAELCATQLLLEVKTKELTASKNQLAENTAQFDKATKNASENCAKIIHDLQNEFVMICKQVPMVFVYIVDSVMVVESIDQDLVYMFTPEKLSFDFPIHCVYRGFYKDMHDDCLECHLITVPVVGVSEAFYTKSLPEFNVTAEIINNN